MDDKNGKKSACWRKTRTLTPSFRDVLDKLEELRVTIEDEQKTLQAQLAATHTEPHSEETETEAVGVGTVNDG
jgi:ethanolamine utilization cobalamin adenosyltransferase